jgi:DivIVA domain-containing protein
MRGYDRRQSMSCSPGSKGRSAAPAAVPVTAADVRAARFAKKMRGYAPMEVDEALRGAGSRPPLTEGYTPVRLIGPTTAISLPAVSWSSILSDTE